MNRRFLQTIAVAVAIAGIATVLFYILISNRLTSGPKETRTRLVVAARELKVGTLINEPDVSIVEWAGSVPANAAVKKEDVVGRGVVATIYKDEPVVESRLAAKGAGAGLGPIIPSGMRAVAIRVNEVIGLAGFVTPGMRVDVIIAGSPPQAPAALGTLSRTLLQNVEVLSAGQQIEKDREGKPVQVQVVNLLVSPEQAEQLSLANAETRIQLVLRNPLDTTIEKTPGTAVARLFSGTAVKPVADVGRTAVRPVFRPATLPVVQPPRPAVVVVEVIQGGRRTETKFEEQKEHRPED